jgi:hypothetical protein
MMGPIARKWPLAIRLVELIYREPAIWVPYKELFLAERIQTEFTITLDECMERLKLFPSVVDVDDYTAALTETQAVYRDSLKTASKLASLVLPGVATTLAELTWAFTVVQSRAVYRDGRCELIPLFDMLNHAPNSCDFSEVTVALAAPVRASMAMDAARNQLRVAWAGPDLQLLRGDVPLGRLDDCCIILAPPGGLRAGEEACTQYHDTAGIKPDMKLGFFMAYGFCPAD